MSGGETTQTQTTTQSLPGNQQRVVDTMLGGALQNFNSGGRTFFPGDIVADFDPNEIAGQNNLINYANGIGSDLVSDAISANSFFMDPNNLFNLDNIPGFSGTEDRLTSNLTDNLTRNILPSIRSGSIASGQFGGTPQGIGEGLAIGETNDAIGDSLSNLYLGAYGQGLNSFNQALNRAPGLFSLGTAPGQLEIAVGQDRRNQAQNEIQGNVARHEFEQNEPIFQLQLLRDLAGRFGDYGGTTNSETTSEVEQSPINRALGAGLSLASLWNPMTSVFSGLGNTAGSGLLGGAGLSNIGSIFDSMLQGRPGFTGVTP